jgi:hypothetical protein
MSGSWSLASGQATEPMLEDIVARTWRRLAYNTHNQHCIEPPSERKDGRANEDISHQFWSTWKPSEALRKLKSPMTVAAVQDTANKHWGATARTAYLPATTLTFHRTSRVSWAGSIEGSVFGLSVQAQSSINVYRATLAFILAPASPKRRFQLHSYNSSRNRPKDNTKASVVPTKGW